MHTGIADVAVIGVPNAEYGEEVKAVVELRQGRLPGRQLTGSCSTTGRPGGPEQVSPERRLVHRLPRDPNGKLYKRRLHEEYWQGHRNAIV